MKGKEKVLVIARNKRRKNKEGEWVVERQHTLQDFVFILATFGMKYDYFLFRFQEPAEGMAEQLLDIFSFWGLEVKRREKKVIQNRLGRDIYVTEVLAEKVGAIKE